jgi:hypothetical protein
MSLQQLINKYPGIEELVQLIRHEVQQAKRPAEEVIYDDVDLRNFLKVSKRTTAHWREKGMITYSKLGGKIYYKLSDVMLLLKQNEVSAVGQHLKIAL